MLTCPKTAICTSSTSSWLQFLKCSFFGSKLIQVPRISTKMVSERWPIQAFHGVFLPCPTSIVPMSALERDCLRKRAVVTCPVKPRHIVGTSIWKSFWKYFYLFHTEQNAPSNWCICSATLTNFASSLCSSFSNYVQRRGPMQTLID